MLRFLSLVLARLSSAYRDRSYFEGLKARLLAAIAILVAGFIPFNIAKILWFQPPLILPRMAVNLIVGAAAMICLRSVMAGRLERAGNGLALAMALSVHGTVLLVGATTRALQPLSVGIQSFAFDLVTLMIAILFASRRIATLVFAIVVVGHAGYYLFMLRTADLSPSEQFSAGTLFRDGLIAMVLIFILGITLVQMIDAAHRRSEEALRQSKRTNEDLERLEHEARGLSERRREFLEVQRVFISMVSHEFRTPLTTIQGTQYLLKSLLKEPAIPVGSVAEKTEKWLGLQASALGTLNKLVDQVLVLNRIEHMTGEASFELIPPGELLKAAVDRINNSMADPRVVLRIDVPPGFTASMDPGLVEAAAENLISNGLKYSGPDKTVQVRIYAESGGWAFEVADQGRGIPPGDQANLYHPFFRAGNVGTIPGTGLGLAIVRRAVDFHGGQIGFRSEENVGTTFNLRFPVAARPPPGADAPDPGPLFRGY